MAKRHRRKKQKKPRSRMGIWATGLAVFSFFCCILVTVVAAMTEGKLPSWAVFLALLALLENFFGLFLALREVRDEELALGFRISGLATTAVMGFIWVFYFVLGLVL